jgi:hypothetical protein
VADVTADTAIRTLSALAAAALRRGALQDEAELAAVLAWLPESARTPQDVETALREALAGLAVGVAELAKPRRALTPVTVTARFPAFRSGRIEAWAAVSADGVWKYGRLEMAGTPWQVEHTPTGVLGDWYGTLAAAREATADGSALLFVEAILAHERGKHDAQRDPACVRC